MVLYIQNFHKPYITLHKNFINNTTLETTTLNLRISIICSYFKIQSTNPDFNWSRKTAEILVKLHSPYQSPASPYVSPWTQPRCTLWPCDKQRSKQSSPECRAPKARPRDLAPSMWTRIVHQQANRPDRRIVDLIQLCRMRWSGWTCGRRKSCLDCLCWGWSLVLRSTQL